MPALVALGVVLAVNLVSVKIFGELEFWFAAIKVLTLVAFMVIAIGVLVTRHEVAGYSTGPQLIFSQGGFFPGGFLAVLMITQGVVFAYAGVAMVGVAAGETDNPRRVIPTAVNSVGWRIAVFYIGSVLLLTMLLPLVDLPGRHQPLRHCAGQAGYSRRGRGDEHRRAHRRAVLGQLGALHDRPKEAFEITTEFSAVGIIGMWSMIMIAHLAMYHATQAGLVDRPAFRLPGAPYTNYVTIAFLLFVLAMTWFNGETGRIVISGTR